MIPMIVIRFLRSRSLMRSFRAFLKRSFDLENEYVADNEPFSVQIHMYAIYYYYDNMGCRVFKGGYKIR